MSDLSPSHKFDYEENATPQEAPSPPNSSHESTYSRCFTRESSSIFGSQIRVRWWGYVDIDDFVQLQTCFDTLSKSHDALNQNVTMLTELITNFIKINPPQEAGHAGHAHGPSRAFVHAGTSLMVPPPHASSTHPAPQPHASSAHAMQLPHSFPIHAHGMQGMQDTHMVSIDELAKEIVEVLKNLKPPRFKGQGQGEKQRYGRHIS